jgi:AraC-like DNA-binding protein/quercetin dioxygenase-like cupin family protein
VSRNGQQAALFVATVPMPVGTVFALHSHPFHQLAWTDAGVLEVATDEGVWVLPPTRALWLPAGLPHETTAVGPTTLRGVYLDPRRCPVKWKRPEAVAVSRLLAALLVHLSGDLDPAARRRAESIVPDLLEPIAVTTIDLEMPADERAREVAEALLVDPADSQSLAQWGRRVGASPRTLSRGFRDGTGITFGRWRTAARIRAALPLLAGGEPIGSVAHAVGYATPSAFVAAFRRETGTTPGVYFRAQGRAGQQ